MILRLFHFDYCYPRAVGWLHLFLILPALLLLIRCSDVDKSRRNALFLFVSVGFIVFADFLGSYFELVGFRVIGLQYIKINLLNFNGGNTLGPTSFLINAFYSIILFFAFIGQKLADKLIHFLFMINWTYAFSSSAVLDYTLVLFKIIQVLAVFVFDNGRACPVESIDYGFAVSCVWLC
jgi:hypothetical protein